MGLSRKVFFLMLLSFLLIPLSGFASEAGLPNQTMGNTLYAAAAEQPMTPDIKQEPSASGIKGFTQTFKSGGGYLDLGLRTGYIYGQNTYDLNHHVSELEFPFRAYLGGGKMNVGYKDLSINSEVWGSIIDDPSAGWHTKDKDWRTTDGALYSDTKSYSDTNAIIWDANLRYNIFRYSFDQKKAYSTDRNSDNIKVGVLLGYRYERFGYKDYGLYQTCYDDSSYGDGEMVSEYKVKYRLPYYGMAMDLKNNKFGVSMSAKYGFKVHAQDYDNHVLRDLHFYGDYKSNGNVFMANFSLFWNFWKNWEASVGADAALIRINGATWDDTHNPSWDTDQSIDTQQFIYWMGLGYKF
ncbi:MAG: omptin family outer membrane protease [Candidatus Omnitrophota bacterium]